MDYEEFIDTLKQYADLGTEEAERAVRATLETLGERLPYGGSGNVLQRLPARVKPWIHAGRDPGSFDVDEFLRRVAEREEVDVEVAARHAREVFWLLGEAVEPEAVADMAACLPEDFDSLIAEAQRRDVQIMPAEEFLVRVASRADLDAAAAHRATEAVLETLAECVAAGRAENLIGELAVPLHEPLKRGRAAGLPTSEWMPLDGFASRVAERQGVQPDEGRRQVQAVFTTLREAITEKGFLDVMLGLPEEYRTLLTES
ncbi:DUF2267 domain-containing protein [Streptosporangium carneum]|uniref:DUF2267 domain-containing protein n=1 Tax=Streptosporangium carneum TaxID=47481 RepID=UPI0022F2CCDC|nr:DUF2267 domain-containing protein [Streptosporangium carneum]